MEKNMNDTRPEADKKLEEIKGLKRIDKLLQQKSKNILGIHVVHNSKETNSLVSSLTFIQDKGADLAIITLRLPDKREDEFHFFEEIKDFRKQVYMPVVIDIDVQQMKDYGIELFSQHAAAAAIDGFSIRGVVTNDYGQNFKPCLDKYGLSLVLPLEIYHESAVNAFGNHLNGFIYITDADKFADGLQLPGKDSGSKTPILVKVTKLDSIGSLLSLADGVILDAKEIFPGSGSGISGDEHSSILLDIVKRMQAT